MGDWTGTVPTHTAGQPEFGEDLAIHAAIDLALTEAPTSYTPTLTNLTLGSGTLVGNYRRLGKRLDLEFAFTFGAGSAVGTGPAFDLPAGMTLASHYVVGTQVHNSGGYLLDAATASRPAALSINSTTQFQIIQLSSGSWVGVTSTSPWTWATGDMLLGWASCWLA